jgi:hypothetical protein
MTKKKYTFDNMDKWPLAYLKKYAMELSIFTNEECSAIGCNDFVYLYALERELNKRGYLIKISNKPIIKKI